MEFSLAILELSFPTILDVVLVVYLKKSYLDTLQTSGNTKWPARRGGQLPDPIQ